MGSGRDATEPTPVYVAVSELQGGLDRLLAVLDAGGLDSSDAAGILGVMQQFEGFWNRLSVVDQRRIGAADTVGVADRACGGGAQT